MQNETYNLEKRRWFHPDKGFFNLKIVWATIIAITCISMIIFLLIISNSELETNLSYKGWNNFINYFKVPLGILATLIPLGAIYATHHRSIQTLEQMNQARIQLKMTESQNVFSNYYKHLEEFEKYCKEHCSESVYKNRRSLYQLAFPNTRQADYSANKELLDAFNESLLKSVSKVKDNWFKKDLTEHITLNTESLLASTQIDRHIELLNQYTQVSKSLYERDDIATKNMVSLHVSCCFLYLMMKDIIEACSFETNFSSPVFLKVFLLDDNPLQIFEEVSRKEDYIVKALNKIRFSDEDFDQRLEGELFISSSSLEFNQVTKIKFMKSINMDILNKKYVM
ncbi:hypothetical protein [Vibrio alginolyticus]|uniref:hypothetical protein n=1 Tax=Vibrio alginolyticus TaxID=663 RepID=UPI001BD29BC2|nr:hypothetical protein [Vibrio alginolyticus]EMC8461176.1 hypothetical protein [Vibrio alginolyticus]EME3935153.1 hypothetical protein [Vibrio alginolyticus]MBS9833204.1 hypothetical protein [Vibrio alginolyticus]MCR9323954.1 hypothetical protein [Vibrio alginolyticus]